MIYIYDEAEGPDRQGRPRLGWHSHGAAESRVTRAAAARRPSAGNVITGASAASYGGGLALFAGSALLASAGSAVSLSGNRARLGGSLLLGASSATLAGRACAIRGGTAAFGGGAFLATAATLRFAAAGGGCDVSGNVASQSGGGGIYAMSGSSVFVARGTEVAFSNNSCKQAGGGVFVGSGASMTVNGSAIFTGLRVRGCYCPRISLKLGCGITADLVTALQGLRRLLNSAGNLADDGGGLAVYNSHFVSLPSSRVMFQANNARVVGGGASCFSSDPRYALSTTDIQGDARFVSNTAFDGGGIYIQGQPNMRALLILRGGNISFEGNRALGDGGAICMVLFLQFGRGWPSFRRQFRQRGRWHTFQ